MKKVAVVKVHSGGCECYDCYGFDFVSSITEWEEVDDDVFIALKNGLGLLNKERERYVLVEFPEQKGIIASSVKGYLEYVEALEREKEEKKQKDAQRRKKAAETRKRKREEKLLAEREERERLYNKLKEEFEK